MQEQHEDDDDDALPDSIQEAFISLGEICESNGFAVLVIASAGGDDSFVFHTAASNQRLLDLSTAAIRVAADLNSQVSLGENQKAPITGNTMRANGGKGKIP